MNSKVVNPLSNPKGVVRACELCAKPAYLQCLKCKVTFYCENDHQVADWKGIHEKICSTLNLLRTPAAIIGSEEERNSREKLKRIRQQQILDIAKTEAHKKLFEGQFDLAIPAALQALRFSMEVSASSMDLVPSYLLLGEASVGLKKFDQAEDYLSLAKWAVLKDGCSDHVIKSQLFRNLGSLYLSQKLYQEAADHLALDIYHCSLAHHPEHIAVTGGYYQLGNVFLEQNKIAEAGAVFDKIVSIWKAAIKVGVHLDEAQHVEAIQMLTHLIDFRATHRKGDFDIAEIQFALATLHNLVGEVDKAKELSTKSLEVYEKAFGRDHSLTCEIIEFMRSIMKS